MINLQGQPGELRFTVQITRKDTGKVEEVELVGRITPEQFEELTNGSDPLDSSPKRSD
jgi:hypothetical protein